MAANSNLISVIDASYMTAFLLPDESTQDIHLTFQQFTQKLVDLVSSALLPFEVTNSLSSAVLTKRISWARANELAKSFAELEITLLHPNIAACLALSQKLSLSIYDASYLEISRRLNAPLLTLDKHLLDITSPSVTP